MKSTMTHKHKRSQREERKADERGHHTIKTSMMYIRRNKQVWNGTKTRRQTGHRKIKARGRPHEEADTEQRRDRQIRREKG
jgi:hypothetical protein